MCSASKYLSVALLIEWSSCSLCESQTLSMALWHCEPTHEGPSYSFVVRLCCTLQTHLNAPCVSILIGFFFCFFFLKGQDFAISALRRKHKAALYQHRATGNLFVEILSGPLSKTKTTTTSYSGEITTPLLTPTPSLTPHPPPSWPHYFIPHRFPLLLLSTCFKKAPGFS